MMIDSDDEDAAGTAKTSTKPRPPPPRPYYKLVLVNGEYVERKVFADGSISDKPKKQLGIDSLRKKLALLKMKLERIAVTARALGFEFEMALLEIRPKRQGQGYAIDGARVYWTGGFYRDNVLHTPLCRTSAMSLGQVMVSALVAAKAVDKQAEARFDLVLSVCVVSVLYREIMPAMALGVTKTCQASDICDASRRLRRRRSRRRKKQPPLPRKLSSPLCRRVQRRSSSSSNSSRPPLRRQAGLGRAALRMRLRPSLSKAPPPLHVGQP